jgi:hypothetical protein
VELEKLEILRETEISEWKVVKVQEEGQMP